MRDIRGDIETHKKQDIAMGYLNLALREYVSGGNMFAVINLACTAEEMLGQIVILSKNENALQRIQR